MAIVENTLELTDVYPIVKKVQPEFRVVRVERRVAGPMTDGFTPEAALIVTFAAGAIPFLAELGKDAYRAFRTALFGAYKKARTWANDRRYAALGIEIRYETEPKMVLIDGEEFEQSEPSIFFAFPPGMECEEFELAIQALLRSYAELNRSPGAYYVVMEFNKESASWTEAYRE